MINTNRVHVISLSRNLPHVGREFREEVDGKMSWVNFHG